MTYDEAIRAATLNGVVLKYNPADLTVSATLGGVTVTESYETVSRKVATVNVITGILGEQK